MRRDSSRLRPAAPRSARSHARRTRADRRRWSRSRGWRLACGARARGAMARPRRLGRHSRGSPRSAARSRRASAWCRRSLYAAAWVLMIAAMMLPTTLPLLAIFRRIVAARPDAGGARRGACSRATQPRGSAFGVVAHGIDVGVREARNVGMAAWRTAGSSARSSSRAAGAFQFSALKYRCLERCRTPFGFVNARWRGRRPLAREPSARRRPRAVLRRLLLGADAGHVRRRHGQRRLDAGRSPPRWRPRRTCRGAPAAHAARRGAAAWAGGIVVANA